MYLKQLNILNYKNIAEADLCFAPKINCLIGMNGMGKTNVLDAVYYLSFCKSAFNSIDSQNIRHEAPFCMIQGEYVGQEEPFMVSCGIKHGQKKQFRLGKKDYKRLIDHIGLIPLVMVSPRDSELVQEGSDERRRFMDGILSQSDKLYLEHLTDYNALLKQRNALLKQAEENAEALNADLMEVIEEQMTVHADYIFAQRTAFIEAFIPLFQEVYDFVAQQKETVSLLYVSQLQNRHLRDAFLQTRNRDVILGWTSQGIHKDDLDMQLAAYPLRRVGSQGQQKTYLIALKLAQALWLTEHHPHRQKPILLLDDIFDKLDAERVERIVSLLGTDRFGQIFITDTDRQHLVSLLQPQAESSKIFVVTDGQVEEL